VEIEGMKDFIYQSVDILVSKLKGYEYRLDRSIPLGSVLGIAARRFAWLCRGVLKCLVLQRRFRLVYMAPQVNLRNTSLIRFGKGVTLDRGVLIDGLSRDGIQFGDNVAIGPYSIIRANLLANLGAGLQIGKDSALDAYSFIGAAGQITIGENVIMGQHVSFHSENHNHERTDIPIKRQGTRRLGIVIEDDCWVGSNAVFLDGCHVEKGCVIGAGSVVRGRIPAYSIAVGAPARVIKSRLRVETESLTAPSLPVSGIA
jgi:acetyltransferase-like isoleucine patch superfamily enzyme